MGLAIRRCEGLAVIWTTKLDFFFLISPKVGQKHQLNLGEDIFFWRPRNFGRKNRFNSGEDLFFGDHLSLNKKTDSN